MLVRAAMDFSAILPEFRIPPENFAAVDFSGIEKLRYDCDSPKRLSWVVI